VNTNTFNRGIYLSLVTGSPSSLFYAYARTRCLAWGSVELGSSTRLYGMRLTAALYNGAVRGQPVDSHVIIVTHQ